LVPKSVTLNGPESHYDVILHLSNWMVQLLELTTSNWLQVDRQSKCVDSSFRKYKGCVGIFMGSPPVTALKRGTSVKKR